jgi:adenosine deaminase
VIGADDPGIFDTDLEKEFETVRKWGVSESEIAQLKKNSLEFTSEKLTSVD